MRTQREQVLAVLRDRRPSPVTSLELLREAGTMRAAARIHELRAEGHAIRTVRVVRGRRRLAAYALDVEARDAGR